MKRAGRDTAPRSGEARWRPLVRASYRQEDMDSMLHMEEPLPELWINHPYQVAVRYGKDGFMHLSIHRRDREAIHDWRHFQLIKNELAGEESEAVELYPAESRLVDTCNEYHLWCSPPGKRLPLGFDDGRLVSEVTIGKAKNRPFEIKPKDLQSKRQIQEKIDKLRKGEGKDRDVQESQRGD